MKKDTYWMVHNPDNNTPTVEHYSESNAISEAKRLARINPGQCFFVLETIKAFCIPAPDVEEIELENIPF